MIRDLLGDYRTQGGDTEAFGFRQDLFLNVRRLFIFLSLPIFFPNAS